MTIQQSLSLTPFLLLLELVLLLAVLFVVVRDVGVGRLVVMSIVRRRRFAGAIQPGELGGADFLGAGRAGHAPGVLGPALLRRAAAGGQEALGHGCSGLNAPLVGASPLHRCCSGQKHVIMTQLKLESDGCPDYFTPSRSLMLYLHEQHESGERYIMFLLFLGCLFYRVMIK